MISEAKVKVKRGLPLLNREECANLDWRGIQGYSGELPIYAKWASYSQVYILDGVSAFEADTGKFVVSYDLKQIKRLLASGVEIQFATAKPAGVPFRGVR